MSAPPRRAIRWSISATRPSAAATCSASGAASGRTRRSAPGGTEALYFPATEGGKVEDGYGEACRPRSDVKAMIFSRVTCMEHLAAGLDDMRAKAMACRGAPFPFVDEFLVSLRKTSSDQATLDRVYGILAAPDTLANLAPERPQ